MAIIGNESWAYEYDPMKKNPSGKRKTDVVLRRHVSQSRTFFFYDVDEGDQS